MWAEDGELLWALGRVASSCWGIQRTGPTSCFCWAHLQACWRQGPSFNKAYNHPSAAKQEEREGQTAMCVCAGQGSGILHATPSVEDLSRLFNTCGVWETQHSPERARQRWHTWPCSQPRVPESARGPLLQATRAAGLIAVPIRLGKSLSASKLLLGNKHRHREWNMPAKYPLAGIQT